MRTLAVALLLVLAGCGGGSDDAPSTTATTSASPTKATTAATPTVAPPKGAPAPEALSRFSCQKDAKGVWNASGYVANDSKGKATFQVTVYVGAASGGEEKAKTRQVPDVAAGGSVRFVINKLPAADDAGPCHVQVLAQR